MESLLILVAIVVIDTIVKKAAKKRKQQQQLPRQGRSRVDNADSGVDDADSRVDDAENGERRQDTAPRGLQDLIRQFEEFQRNTSGGTYVPPSPPVDDIDEDLDDEEDDEDDVELPVVRPVKPGHFSFKEIAESVIQWEEVSIDYLQDAFGFSGATATKVLAELQSHRIVGRNMGDGYCDVLVHDKVELANLFKREQAEEKKRVEEDLARKKAELDRQKELKELERRAREAREHAGTDLAEAAALAARNEGSAIRRAPLLSAKSTADIRRGFLWAKVIDEPRFKKRWSARAR